MIRKVEMYQAACYGCGKREKQMFDNSQDAQNIAVWRGWLIVGYNVYCPLCVGWDEETKSYKPKNKKL